MQLKQRKKETMFDLKMLSFQNVQVSGENSYGKNQAYQYNTALNKFKSTLSKGRVVRVLKRALNRAQRLYDLNHLKPELHVRGSSYSGVQVVPICSIIGSEGRTADFDVDFHPVSEAARERWVGVAIAYLERLPLPPVQLIQVGGAYFVRDGHHRISVSRAFGQIVVDAEVITWKASPPFPWQGAAEKRSVFSKAITYPLD
jgi:hypothetical protein